MACVELPAFPLQLLLRRRPDWAGRPVAVVDRDKPQGVILWANEAAREARIRTGMRYSAGLSLARTLHAGEVPPAEIEREVASLAERLRRFSPDVEPCRDEPGVFWLNASGLSHLWASLREWADAVLAALRAGGLRGAVAVGFTRFGTYAVARTAATAATGPAATVLQDPATERVLAGQAPLDRLGIDPALRDSLQKLGIGTVRAFLQLPPAGVRRRFGADAERLHRLAAGDLWAPLQPLPVREPLVARHDLDDPETDVSRLLFLVKRLLNRVLTRIVARQEALAELTLDLRLERAPAQTERIRPAAPTLDAAQLLNLVRLRLEARFRPEARLSQEARLRSTAPAPSATVSGTPGERTFGAGVTSLRVAALAVRITSAQAGLFAVRPRHDPAAADRALARIRAEFGDEAVVRARLVEAHLPEARFAWEPLVPSPRSGPAPAPADTACRPLVRRIHARPVPLPPRPRHEPDGWLLRGGVAGHVEDLAGPYLVSGGWWRAAVHREYYFARMRDGDVLWIYYDRPRRRWCWQGRVE
ncbi:MAG: DNA polymerase Y family protein [Acidobacteria bacterium]|nr:DNA polymerase Y family protein [Acidobacteriota bacterium]